MFIPSQRESFAIYIVLVSLFFTSCAPKISSFSSSNRYVKGFNIHAVNDSLQIHLITPADFTYLTTKTAIKKAIKQYHLKVTNEILFISTTETPTYQFVVSIGNQQEKVSRHKLVHDTTINEQTIHLMTFYPDKTAEQSATADLRNIYQALKIGKNYQEEMNSVMDIVNRSMNKNKFLQTLTEIQQFKIPKNQANSLELQMQLTYSSFLGRNDVYKSFINQQEKNFKPNNNILSVIKNNKLGDEMAIDHMTKIAKETNILMINENHYYPNQRLLLLTLLPQLKKIGYTHLALEALDNPADSLLNLPQAYPKLSSGFYTIEQNFGNLLREAKRLGFKFVAYENRDPKIDREIGQATNLYNRTIGTDKNAKVVVLAGIDHILEEPTSSGKKWMATILKEKFQLDPITISQTHLNLYRSYSPYKFQLFSHNELASIQPKIAVDYFILNNEYMTPLLWNNTYNYQNKNNQKVQINLFYLKEMKNEHDYHLNIPYFSSVAEEKKHYMLPYLSNEPTLLVVYDQLGTVLEKRIIN